TRHSSRPNRSWANLGTDPSSQPRATLTAYMAVNVARNVPSSPSPIQRARRAPARGCAERLQSSYGGPGFGFGTGGSGIGGMRGGKADRGEAHREAPPPAS